MIFYESYIDGQIDIPLCLTKTGDKPIGGIFKVEAGNLVVLPAIQYPDRFTRTTKDGEAWTQEAIKFGNRFIQLIVDIDSSLKRESTITPPPAWMYNNKYQTAREISLSTQISQIDKNIEELNALKISHQESLVKERLLKNLLFEKGIPLEDAIIEALRIIVYEAEKYDDGKLQLDQVIISPEKVRYIGESEGKDDSAINIDKFRQLEVNIQEDLSRAEVDEPAIGILFANGFRLQEPSSRPVQFTNKCLTNAERLKCVLIATSDLFNVVKYLKENDDNDFAKKCRDAILNSRGKICKFPEIPQKQI